MTAGWSFCWPIRGPRRTAAGCWSSTIRGTGRTARRPLMWAGSGWAGTARPTTGWSPSPRCGLMSACITRCTRCPTPRRGTSPRGRATRDSGPSWPIGAGLAVKAREAGFSFRAVVADSAYGDQDGFRAELAEAGLPFVMALRPRRGIWARVADAHTPVDAARELRWGGPDDPGDWQAVTRRFRDGHAETWYAADATLGAWGPDGARRLVAVTADPGTLPDKATWYLVTNLARPGGPREEDSPWPAAGLAEIARIYGLRHWVEQSYKQVKDELGWADFQVRSDIAIRRHQVLVNCAFSFCWDTWLTSQPPPGPAPASPPERGHRSPVPAAPDMPGYPASTKLAPRAARRPQLADPRDHAHTLVAGMVEGAPAR